MWSEPHTPLPTLFFRRVRVTVSLALIALSGCGADIAIVDEFPTPLIEPLPLSVGVYYDDEISYFQFLDKTSDGSEWSVDMGAANIRMLDKVLGAMFAQVQPVGNPESGDKLPAGIDGVIAPKIQEYAFLTPAEQGSKFFAVSIRYSIQVHGPDGKLLKSWLVNAYGKSRSKLLKGGESLAEATRYAMRDAAAALAEEYRERPELKVLLPDEETPDENEIDEDNSTDT